MYTNIEIIHKALKDFYPKLYMNDISIANFSGIEFKNDSFKNLSPTKLYVIDFSNNLFSEEYFLHLKKGNFLILEAPAKYHNFFQQQVGGNYILIEKSSQLSLIYRKIHSCIDAFSTLQSYYPEILNGFYLKKGIEYYVNLTGKILGNSIMLFNKENELVAHSDTLDLNQKFYWDITSSVAPPQLSVMKSQYKEIQKNSPLWFEFPQLFEDSDNRGYGATLQSYVFLNKKYSYFLTVLEDVQRITEKDYVLLAYMTNVIEHYYTNKTAKFVAEDSALGKYVKQVLGGQESEFHIRLEAQKLDKEYKSHYMILIVDKKKEKRAGEYLVLLTELHNKLSCQIVQYEFSVMVFLTGTKEKCSSEYEKVKKFLEEKISENWCASLSLYFSSFTELKTVHEQCKTAIKFGKIFEPEKVIYFYQRYMNTHLLNIASAHFDLTGYCLPVTEEIVAYDEKYNTEYGKTLYTYLQSFKDITAAANMLHIHKNSLSYRLNKISEIFHIDYDDYLLMNNLKISLEILLFL